MKLRQYLVIPIFVLFYSTINAQTETNNLPVKITIGHFDTLKSVIYNKSIPLQVSVPTEFSDCPPNQRFPLALVLDGSVHFNSFVGMVHRFSSFKFGSITPKMIVVGIDVPDRYNELYPNIENDNFGDFLKTELIPFLDSSYQTLPNRLFVGHSMSGLRGAHTAIFDSNLFESFILIDPSLSEKDFEWYNRSQAHMSDFNPKNKKIFLAMAQTMPPSYPGDIESIKRDTTSHSTHMRAIIGFSEAMKEKNTENNEFYNWKYYPNETHYSVTHIAMHDGLRFIYDYYYDYHYLYIYDDNISPNQALNRFKEYFRILGEKQDTKPFPIQEYFLMYDSGFERRGQIEKARLFAKYYLECYPQSDTAKYIVNKYK